MVRREGRGGPVTKGVDVSEPASLSAGIASRYATAMFELAQEGKSLPALESDIDALSQALTESDDLRALINSPVYTREEQGKAITAVSSKMGLSQNMTNMLGLMASKRRLFVIPALLGALSALIAAEKGEVTAEVRAAKALTNAV